MATSTALPDASTLASKRVIYVGGLTDGATIPMIRAAFIPFGNIKSVDMVRRTAIASDVAVLFS